VNIGILLPGFSSDESDWAIPVQLNLIRELARNEDVRVLALRYPHRRDHYVVHDAHVYSLGVGQVRGIRRLMLWIDALRTLRKLHHEKPFDVLHAMWADETGLTAAWAGRMLHIPVVVSVAGGELVGFHDLGYGLQRSAFSRWIVRQAISGADCVIIACEHVRRLLPNVPPEKINKIVLGVNADLFSPSDSPPQNHHLVHLGSLVTVKDQATLLRAVARLPDVTLDIVGEGPELPHLQHLASQLGIADRVQFCGAVHHLQTPQYYQRAQLHILTSRHEGLGMVTLEAAACGVPTIGTDVGLLPDCPEIGITVPVGDDRALADAISLLLNDPQRNQALRLSARVAVLQRYTIQKTAADLHARYQDFVKISQG
jgi:glycosyltransferase involved in cell wall biosynthesis